MNRSFLSSQFKYLFQTWPGRRSLWHRCHFPVELWRILAGYAKLRYALSRNAPSMNTGGKTCAVILLSHNRPQNLEILVRGALHNAFVTKVVVSNSNRKVCIGDWVSVKDKRLRLIDETESTQPGHRFVLADREPGDYFLSVDDDIFLTPRQWGRLFECLLQNESVPHGITGQQYRPGAISSNGSPFHHVAEAEAEVDVLIGAYAFTRSHLGRLFTLAEKLGMGPVSNLHNGEDILLSFAGAGLPCIHNFGRIFCCASSGLPGVAIWQSQQNFWAERVELFEKLRNAKL